MSERTSRLEETDVHTRAEFEAAISALTEAEHHRLRRVAMSLRGTSGMAENDLLQEAHCRAFAGTRRWPRHIDVVKFMVGAMQSIANAAYEANEMADSLSYIRATDRSPNDIEGLADGEGVLVQFRRPPPSPEDALIIREEAAAHATLLHDWRKQLVDTFADDYEAQLMVEGMMEGYQGTELRQFAGLSSTEFPTKYKKVHRRIETLKTRRNQS